MVRGDREITTYYNRIIVPAINFINENLEKRAASNRLLLSVDHLHIHEMIVTLVDLMVNKKYWKGSVITIDRPYNYLLRTLKSREINLSRLFVVDIITGLTTERFDPPPNVAVLNSPFFYDLEHEIIETWSRAVDENGTKRIQTWNFLLFDNFVVLDHYIERHQILKIFHTLNDYLAKFPQLKVMIVYDSKRSERFSDLFKGWADQEISL